MQGGQSKKVITNKTVLPPVVVKQEYPASAVTNKRLNNNIPSHLDVPKKLPSAKKSPPPEIKSEGEYFNPQLILSIICYDSRELKCSISWENLEHKLGSTREIIIYPCLIFFRAPPYFAPMDTCALSSLS